jgi:menaquinone-dependent protoporphyrinogen oxidase
VKALIAYGTTEGQTAHIAEELRLRLTERGIPADAVDLERQSPDLATYDRVVVAGSIHVGKYQREVSRFVSSNVGLLNQLPSWFVGVSMAEASGQAEGGHETAQALIDQFVEKHGWRPAGTMSLAGALKYRDYNFLTRFIVKRIAGRAGQQTDTSRNWEYTDWNAVDRLADEIASSAARE